MRQPASAWQQLEELKRIANGRICGNCLERHNIDVLCPPVEVRTRGQAWFRAELDERNKRIERLREALEQIVCWRWSEIKHLEALVAQRDAEINRLYQELEDD